MKALNYVIIATLFTIFFASCSQDEPSETIVIDDAIAVLAELELPSCEIPEFGEEVCEVPVTESLESFSSCMEDFYDDSEIPAFEWEGEVYEYEPLGAEDDAILSLASVYFYAGLANGGVDVIQIGRGGVAYRGWLDKLWKCLVEVLGVNDARKLFKHIQNGTLTYKRAWRIAKRFIKRKFGPIGAAITICDLALCLA